MRLENDFYKLLSLSATENGWEATVELNHEHRIYEGHFPQQAVVPGVCTLTMIREILSKALGKAVRFSHIKECKYVSALLPQKGMQVDFVMELQGDVLKCSASKEGETVLKLSATVADE